MTNRHSSLSEIYGVGKKFIQRYTIFVALAGFCLFFSIASENFFQTRNLIAIVRSATTLGIISCGMTLVIIAGGIDLSVGALVGMIGFIIAKLILQGVGSFFSLFLIAICVGIAVGFTNGIIITQLKISPLIVTLAIMMCLDGLKLVIYGGQDILIHSVPPCLSYISRGFVGPVPISVFLFISVIILSSVILYKTVFGRKIYAVGVDSHIAYLMGINPSRVRIITYVFLGILVYLSSLILVGRIGGYSIMLGQDYAMDAILAVVVGGTSLSGGRGTIEGSIGGVLLVATLRNGLTLIAVPYSFQIVILGIIFISVVTLDSYYHRLRE